MKRAYFLVKTKKNQMSDKKICVTCRDSPSSKEGGLTNKQLDRIGFYVKQQRTRAAKIKAIQKSGKCDAACKRASLRKSSVSKRAVAARKKISTRKKQSKKGATTARVEANDAEDALWALVESLNWRSDQDAPRVRSMIRSWSPAVRSAFDAFVFEKVQQLIHRFAQASDTSLEEVAGEIVARGKRFYDSADKQVLRRMRTAFEAQQETGGFFFATDVEELT